MTLLELVIASTVTAVLLALAGPAWRSIVYEAKLVERRATVLSELQVARAFLVADAAAAGSPATCADGSVPSLPLGTVDGVPAVAEYRLRDGNLYRWAWPADQEILVARGIASMSCSAPAPGQLTVELTGGEALFPGRLIVQLTTAPESQS